eukprot:scaffold5553_cov121-Pinguiococcus_pyrenoidosus.AAC.1
MGWITVLAKSIRQSWPRRTKVVWPNSIGCERSSSVKYGLAPWKLPGSRPSSPAPSSPGAV